MKLLNSIVIIPVSNIPFDLGYINFIASNQGCFPLSSFIFRRKRPCAEESFHKMVESALVQGQYFLL